MQPLVLTGVVRTVELTVVLWLVVVLSSVIGLVLVGDVVLVASVVVDKTGCVVPSVGVVDDTDEVVLDTISIQLILVLILRFLHLTSST